MMFVALTLLGLLGLLAAVVLAVLAMLKRAKWKVAGLTALASLVVFVIGVAIAPESGTAFKNGYEAGKRAAENAWNPNQQSQEQPKPQPQQQQQEKPQTQAQPQTQATPANMTARGIAEALKNKGLPIGDIGNEQRNQKFESVEFTDTRTPNQKGMVLVFDSEQDASRFFDVAADLYQKGKLSGNAFVDGKVVISPPGGLSPEQFHEYELKLSEMLNP